MLDYDVQKVVVLLERLVALHEEYPPVPVNENFLAWCRQQRELEPAPAPPAPAFEGGLSDALLGVYATFPRTDEQVWQLVRLLAREVLYHRSQPRLSEEQKVERKEEDHAHADHD
jgi:hypothetical protein